jgi:hypothetical protein
MDGRYSIKAKTGDDLVFSFVGMAETIKKWEQQTLLMFQCNLEKA